MQASQPLHPKEGTLRVKKASDLLLAREISLKIHKDGKAKKKDAGWEKKNFLQLQINEQHLRQLIPRSQRLI